MLVVACIKQVPDTTQVKIDPVTNTLVREGVPFIINPFDIHALEEALRIRDRFGCRVTAISMGPPNAEATLRKALSLGVDEAILVSDRCFGGADTLATSNVLAEAIRRLVKREDVGLVICGKQTIDGDTAQVGPQTADKLNIPQVTYAEQIIDIKKNKVTIKRKIDGGHEIVQATLPVLVTVIKVSSLATKSSSENSPIRD